MTRQVYIEYDRSNNDHAKQNRKKQTPAEEKIRNDLLRKKQLGHKFTRQKPLGPFIADFYCSKLSLVIEIDGPIHRKQYVEDTQRTDVINDLGIVVIRYSNDEVLGDITGVKEDLLKTIKERERDMKDKNQESLPG